MMRAHGMVRRHVVVKCYSSGPLCIRKCRCGVTMAELSTAEADRLIARHVREAEGAE